MPIGWTGLAEPGGCKPGCATRGVATVGPTCHRDEKAWVLGSTMCCTSIPGGGPALANLVLRLTMRQGQRWSLGLGPGSGEGQGYKGDGFLGARLRLGLGVGLRRREATGRGCTLGRVALLALRLALRRIRHALLEAVVHVGDALLHLVRVRGRVSYSWLGLA